MGEREVAALLAVLARKQLLTQVEALAADAEAFIPEDARPANFGALVAAAWHHAMQEAVAFHDAMVGQIPKYRKAYQVVSDYAESRIAQRTAV